MKNHGSGKVAGSLLLAFLLFMLVLVAACGAMAELGTLQRKGNDVVLSDWEFAWSDQKQPLEGNIDHWRQATGKTPVQKEIAALFSARYVRLHATLPAASDARLLELITANNPIKVSLNGSEIYNNHYDADAFTGNRVNAVTIPASSAPVELDVFMRVPFAFSLSARLAAPPSALTAGSAADQIGLIGASVFFTIGILLVFLLFLFSATRKGLSAAFGLAFTVIVSGGGALLSQFSFHSSALTNPWLFKVQLMILPLTALGLLYTSVNAVGGWKSAEKITALLSALYAAAFLLMKDSFEIWLLSGFPVLLLFIAVLVTLRLSGAIRNRITGSITVCSVFLAAVFCLLYDTLSLLTGWSILRVELRYAGMVLYAAAVFLVLVKQAVYTNIRMAERERQIEKDTRWVEKTVASCANIFAQQGISNFCVETAKAVKDLIVFDRQNEGEELPSVSPLHIQMATLNNGRFEEIYTEDRSEPCDYARIRARSEQNNDKTLLFGEHSLDMLLYAGKNLLCVLHVDGIADGFSPNLQNMIRSAYTGISAALNNLELKMDLIEMQESVFINLAEIVEQKSSGTGEHLKIVASMVEAMCEELRMPEREKHLVAMASMVHDIGKLAIPEAILEKKGKLTEDEFALMQDHVIYGYNMMSKSPGEFMQAAAVVAQQHHEKYDGTGYLELRGEQIHLYARIVSIADVFDALLSERPYKEAWTPEKAGAFINEQSGKQFDPRMVEIFNRCKDRLVAVKCQFSS